MRRFGSMWFMVVSVMLVLSTAFCIGGTVMSRSSAAATFEEMENYYRPKEIAVVEATREFLSDAGYRNCGITMNHVVDTDGSREYTLMMHHSKFDQLDEAEKYELVSSLAELTFEDEQCSFEHLFI